ncbi:MAG: flavin reductase family protein [Spirochaetales bacterium]|jgi:flavin reductase (DIM6/NTAB) family NADH-FMN oxidoreductase RutF|nr:flavin reductase family protein [Spirochaetales bacterium]
MMKKHYTPHDRSVPQSAEEPFKTPGYVPVSAALISVADTDTGIPNIMPLVAWGWYNRHPFLIGVSICVKEYNKNYFERGTYEIMRKTMDFALNIPTEKLRDKITRSGELSRKKNPKVDKFTELGLTALPGQRIKSPHIAECPLSYECEVRAIVNLGSHDLFLGEVVGCVSDGEIIEVQTVHGNDNITMKREDGSKLTLEWSTLMKVKE